jgi:hypothetical protein
MSSRWQARVDDTRRTLSIEWALTSIEVGIVAGAIAGLCMPLVASLVALAKGEDALAPPEAIVEMFFGELHAGTDLTIIIVIAGTVAHVLLSAVYGVMFALFSGVSRRAPSRLALLATGMAWGVGRWLSNTFLVAPRLAGGALITATMPAWTWAAGHLLYGAVLGLLYFRWRHYIAFDTLDGAALRPTGIATSGAQ